ncbi:hypothetical protein LJR219_004271 [Phenylobacterium sp. LjRoot219]|uniref:hypothetical protein n=1 Tax=Phenylobacterium sp. LjRoot219 TaxID=3342283 RepID=UPI003ED0CCF2
MEFHVEQTIHAAPADVAQSMFDPDLEDRWTGGKAEKLTPEPIGVGARVRTAACSDCAAPSSQKSPSSSQSAG